MSEASQVRQTFIFYKGKNYFVPTDEFFRLINDPVNRKLSDDLSLKLGIIDNHNSSFSCEYCIHNSNSTFLTAASTANIGISNQKGGTPGISVKGCNYLNPELRYTRTFVGPEGVFDAWATPCAALDAEVISLITSGSIGQYEVPLTRQYPFIINIIQEHQKAEQRNQDKKSGLINRIKGFFGK